MFVPSASSILLQLPKRCLNGCQNYCQTDFQCFLFPVCPGLHLHVSQFFQSFSVFVFPFQCPLHVQHLVSPLPSLGFPLSIFLCCPCGRSFGVLSAPAGQVSPAAPHCSTFPLQPPLCSSAFVSLLLNMGCKSCCYCSLRWHPQFHDLQPCLSLLHQRLPHGSS